MSEHTVNCLGPSTLCADFDMAVTTNCRSLVATSSHKQQLWQCGHMRNSQQKEPSIKCVLAFNNSPSRDHTSFCCHIPALSQLLLCQHTHSLQGTE